MNIQKIVILGLALSAVGVFGMDPRWMASKINFAVETDEALGVPPLRIYADRLYRVETARVAIVTELFARVLGLKDEKRITNKLSAEQEKLLSVYYSLIRPDNLVIKYGGQPLKFGDDIGVRNALLSGDHQFSIEIKNK